MSKERPETREANYESPALVSLWTDFIDWEKRRAGEKGFLEKQLRRFGCRKVFDAALGDGCDSIHLLKKGFDVTSNEIDRLFLELARQNARKNNVRLKVTGRDWRTLGRFFPENSFDAVILLGNSLTYLFRSRDQLLTLRAFRKILRTGGVLVIDERNYQYMLDYGKEILGGDFRYSKKYIYCGKKVHAAPTEITAKKVVMNYVHENGKAGNLVLYPFKAGEMVQLLEQSGFAKITRYSDYKPGFDPESDFFQYVAVK